MKDVQCYELFGEIAHKNHGFSFFNVSSHLFCSVLSRGIKYGYDCLRLYDFFRSKFCNICNSVFITHVVVMSNNRTDDDMTVLNSGIINESD